MPKGYLEIPRLKGSKKLKLKGPGATPKVRGGSRRSPLKKIRPPKVPEIKQEEPMGLIQGQVPESSYEWNMAKALWGYGWEFIYQVNVWGGQQIRGGLRLDFLVKTRPFWTALSVDGGYWHRNSGGLVYRDSRLIQGLRNRGFKVEQDVLHAIDKDCITIDDARKFVAKELGRG